MEYIQVQSETVGKTLKVKLNNSTITVLSKIFNLQPETIYLIGEDNVVMPDPETMLINEEDILSYVIYRWDQSSPRSVTERDSFCWHYLVSKQLASFSRHSKKLLNSSEKYSGVVLLHSI